jgi:hypothetical protein
MLAIDSPDLQLFWSAYDPLDLASASIDVLGFQAGYIALADKLLPGFTTVTTSPRYVSMLCAAVRAAEAAHPGAGEATSQLRQARMAALKSYERAWALACGFAAADNRFGESAVDGLRGVRYANRRLSELSGREKAIRTSSFNLLANQVRYGGIGAYSTLLEECHLAAMRSITPRPLGVQLAESFPTPGDNLAVWDEDRPLPIDELREWGARCHLGEFSHDEARSLATALKGGEERGWDDDVRWATLRMLANSAGDEPGEAALLDRLLKMIQAGEFDRLKLPPACVQQVEATIVMIRPYERLYQAVQFLFDAVRAAATDEPQVHLGSLVIASHCIPARDIVKAASFDLLSAIGQAEAIHAQAAHEVRQTFVETGVLSFADSSKSISDGTAVLDAVLDRHRDVQQGKFDRGQPKAPWVRRDAINGTARLTAQRHQLPRSGRYDGWEQVPRHPFRTYGARRFVKACGIR